MKILWRTSSSRVSRPHPNKLGSIFYTLLILGILVISFSAKSEETLKLAPEHNLPKVKLTLKENELAILKSQTLLRIGVTSGYEPLSQVREKTVKGIMIDYLEIISKSLGLTLEVKTYPDWQAAIKALYSGDIDILGRGSSYEANLPRLILSKPYALNQPVLVERDNNQSTTIISNEKLAVVAGYVPLDELQARFSNKTIEIYPTIKEALHALEYNRTHLLVGDATTVAYHIALGELPNLHMRALSDWSQAGYSFVMRSSDSPMISIINQVLEKIPEPTKANILTRWGSEARFGIRSPTLYSAEEGSWLATRPEVNVVVSSEAPPYSFYDEEGNFKGLVADLLDEIGRRSGLKFKLVNASSLSEGLNSLKSGEAELATMLRPTPERKSFLHFTESYVNSSFALVGRKKLTGETLANLAGKRVAVLKDSTPTLYLKKHYPDIELIYTYSYLDSLATVASGKAEATVLFLPIARYMIREYFSEELRIITSLPQIQSESGFAIARNRPLLIGVIEKTLEDIEPRLISNIVERWQNSVPAEGSVWAEYELRFRRLGFVGLSILLLLLTWQIYNYFLRLRKREEERQIAFRSELLDGIPEAVVARDLQGRFLLCNNSFYTVFDLQPSDVIGRCWTEISGLDATQEPSQRHIFESLLHGHQHIDVQNIQFKIRGELLTFRQWIVPHRGSDGCIAGVLMGWIDISTNERLLNELKIVKDQAVAANSAKSQFLAVMSHEIRTPLNAIIGLLELTMERVDKGDEWDRSAIEVAYSSSRSLMLVIGDILDLAKIESGKLTLDPQPTCPQDILKTMHRIFQGLAKQKGLYLITEFDIGSALDVLIDGDRLKQILSNLLGNAIKFTYHGGVRISLKTLKVDSNLLITYTIEDTGVGISKADQKTLFEPFTQAGSKKGQHGGSGLGLVICKQFIEMMQGTLQLESVLGHGTRIEVKVKAPILVRKEDKQQLIVAEETQERFLSVALVDDHPANRLLLEQQLKFLGHEVVEFEDGSEAFARLQIERFDAIITDCNMPIMNGYELTRRIRALEQKSGLNPTYIIGFTANAQLDERKRCLESGMNECLFKPVSLSVLRGSLYNLSKYQSDEFVPRVPEPYVAPLKKTVLDFEMLDSLTGGDLRLTRMLLDRLYSSNELDIQVFDELLTACRWHDLGQLVHRIKGAARMVGAQLVRDASASYEEGLSQSLTDEEAKQLAERVRAAMQELQESVADWLAAP